MLTARMGYLEVEYGVCRSRKRVMYNEKYGDDKGT